MRREKKEQNKNLMLADISKYIAEGHKIVELEIYTKKKILEYFPNADDVFIEVFKVYADTLQNKYHYEESIYEVLKKYK